MHFYRCHRSSWHTTRRVMSPTICPPAPGRLKPLIAAYGVRDVCSMLWPATKDLCNHQVSLVWSFKSSLYSHYIPLIRRCSGASVFKFECLFLCCSYSNKTSAHNRLEGLIVLVPFNESLLAFKTFMHHISFFFLCMLSHAVVVFLCFVTLFWEVLC